MDPPSELDWEHDVGRSIAGKTIGLIGICAFWFGLMGWFPGSQHVPLWVKVAAVASGLLIVSALPLRWFILRPWVIVAETTGDQNLDSERWSGLVRTRAAAREEVELIARSIRATGTPEYEPDIFLWRRDVERGKMLR
jgi:hypothetical protein